MDTTNNLCSQKYKGKEKQLKISNLINIEKKKNK